MILWVIFIWAGSTAQVPAAYAYRTQAECVEAAETYRRATCVQVAVPHPKRVQ